MLWRLAYTLLAHLVLPIALLRSLWKGRKQPGYLRNFPERFGRYSGQPDRPVIWLHAVSVGETRAAEPLVKALESDWPDHQILLTTLTPTGRATARQAFGERVLCCYVPYDVPWAVGAFLRHYQPRLGALLETELWPNLIHGCRSRGVPLFLVNARLSERSARGYGRVAALTRGALGGLAGVAAQSTADAQRLAALGAQQVVVTGNLKFDRGPQAADFARAQHLRALFGPDRPVFVAASTREGEEELVLDALAGAPSELLTVIVPRHIQRFDAVAALLARRGLRVQRRSDDRPILADTQAVLGDSMGELFAYYGACDVAFIGGSLLPLGGQNLLEACAMGKPVLIGPHTFNFTEATRLAVEAGAAVRVRDSTELGDALAALLRDAVHREAMGRAGIELMKQHQGATQRTLALLGPVLGRESRLSAPDRPTAC
jgi:3-deoxy-D-manno-octulosonic-acid transferase